MNGPIRDYKRSARRSFDVARLREFGAGVLVGLVLATGIFAYTHRHSAAAPRTPHPDAHRSTPATQAATAAAKSAESGPGHFDFYEMLPNFEVVVPETDHDVKRDSDLENAKIQRPGAYVLQAGSYRKQSDAQRVAKQLSMEGIHAKVQRVAVDKDVWHRVRIGPISDLAKLNRIRKKLRAADVDALVIRVGDR